MDNQNIYFADDHVFSKISEILNKNDIDVDLLSSAFENKETFIDIVYKLAKSLAENTITEKDFIESIKQKLGANDAAAQNILDNLKKELLPFAKNASESEENNLVKKEPKIKKEDKTKTAVTPPQKKRAPDIIDKYHEPIE
jgi:hypothetical protein